MKYFFVLCLTLFASPAFAYYEGWYCYAQAPTGERVLKSDYTLDKAKNAARKACFEKYDATCQIVQCYEKSPYKYACVAGKPTGNRIGAHRTFSNSEDAARQVAMRNCKARNGNACISICYPNFTPPLEDLK